MKAKSKISGYIILRSVHVFLSVAFIAVIQRLIRRMHGINPPWRMSAREHGEKSEPTQSVELRRARSVSASN